MRTQSNPAWLLLSLLSLVILLPGDPGRAAAENPIVEAAKEGDLPAVRALIAKRANVNEPSRDGSTPLLWAAYHSDLEMARALIAAGAAVNTSNKYGITPLLQASRTGDTAMIAALLDAGADVARAHPDGETPLMAVSRAGRADAARLLLARGAEVNAADTYQQQTALMWAAAQGHADVASILLKAGANPNLKAHVTSLAKREHEDHPSGGFTALMFAARNGHENVVRTLAEGGADLNLTNGDDANKFNGATAMIIAIVNDRLDLAATLLELGADPNDGSLYHAVDMHDATTDMRARDGSLLRWDHPNKLTALDLIKLLLDRGADPNKPFVGQLHSTSLCCGDFANGSPFYRAAIASDVEVLKLMIAKGASVEWTPGEVKLERSENGAGQGAGGRGANANMYRQPIFVAMIGGRGAGLAAGPGFNRLGPPPFREASNRKPVDAVKTLLAAGADPNAWGPDGGTPLHKAAQDRADLDIIRALVAGGATLDYLNIEGLTPLEVAEKPAPTGRGAGAGADPDAPADTRPSRQAVAALFRELMGLPPAEVKPAETPKPAAAVSSERAQ